MSEPSETPFWINFFIEAGIPPSISTEYAITFSDNRIKESMLLDLDKEYLKEMGITVLGDIISILKHAKSFHHNKNRQHLISSSVKSKQATNAIEGSTRVQKNPVAVRMLKHYVQRQISPKPDVSNVNVAVKRAREEDSSPKPNKRNSVFERLGDNLVSSTTQETPKITVTMLGKSDPKRGGDPSLSAKGHPLQRKNISGEEGLEYHGIFKYSQSELAAREKANRQDLKGSANLSLRTGTTKASLSNIKHRLGTPVNVCKSEGILAREFRGETLEVQAKNVQSVSNVKLDTRKFVAMSKKTKSKLKKARAGNLSHIKDNGTLVIKKIIRVNKRTGQIIGNKTD